MNKINTSKYLLRFVFLLSTIFLLFTVFVEIFHENPSTKHASSMLARDGVLRALRSQSICLNEYTLSCDKEFEINFEYLTKKSDSEFIYRNKKLGYTIYFIKEFGDWVCYFPENSYPVASCKTIKLG
jgi:hypothetical protein